MFGQSPNAICLTVFGAIYSASPNVIRTGARYVGSANAICPLRGRDMFGQSLNAICLTVFGAIYSASPNVIRTGARCVCFANVIYSASPNVIYRFAV